VERKSLRDVEISSRRIVSRRALLHTLGIGGAAAGAAIGTTLAQPQPKPKPADPCRDRDHGPSDRDGCPTS
jgi:hypothetical protein